MIIIRPPLEAKKKKIYFASQSDESWQSLTARSESVYCTNLVRCRISSHNLVPWQLGNLRKWLRSGNELISKAEDTQIFLYIWNWLVFTCNWATAFWNSSTFLSSQEPPYNQAKFIKGALEQYISTLQLEICGLQFPEFSSQPCSRTIVLESWLYW